MIIELLPLFCPLAVWLCFSRLKTEFRGDLAHEKGVCHVHDSRLFGMLLIACVAHQIITIEESKIGWFIDR